jgi:hypothetical protein
LGKSVSQENDFYGSCDILNDATASGDNQIVALQATDNTYYMSNVGEEEEEEESNAMFRTK